MKGPCRTVAWGLNLLAALTAGGCLAGHADLLAMRKVRVTVTEGTGLHVYRLRVLAEKRGLSVRGEIRGDRRKREDRVQVSVVLASPGGEILAETQSPTLVLRRTVRGIGVPKGVFAIPLHTRAEEGAALRVTVRRTVAAPAP